jgi:hypothetical protein
MTSYKGRAEIVGEGAKSERQPAVEIVDIDVDAWVGKILDPGGAIEGDGMVTVTLIDGGDTVAGRSAEALMVNQAPPPGFGLQGRMAFGPPLLSST